MSKQNYLVTNFNILILILFNLFSSEISAQDIVYWDGEGNDGLWSSKENWSNDQVPSDTIYVIIEGDGAIVVIDIDAKAHNILIREKAQVKIEKSLTIENGTVSNSFEFVSIRTSGKLTNYGSLVINNVTGDGIEVHETGIFESIGTELRLQNISGGSGIINRGYATLRNTSMYFIDQEAIFNEGSLAIESDVLIQDLVFSSAIGISNFGTIDISPSGNVMIRGQIGGLTSIINQFQSIINNRGIINVSDAQTIGIHNIGTLNNYARININNVTENAIVNGGVWNNETSALCEIRNVTAPSKSAIFNSSGLINNNGEITIDDIQYIGLDNDGTFNNYETFTIDSTKTSSAIRNSGSILNQGNISLSHINYLNGARPYIFDNQSGAVLTNVTYIFMIFSNSNGIYNEGIIESISPSSIFNLSYVQGDLLTNEIGATFEGNYDLYLSKIF